MDDSILRDQLVQLLRGGNAHLTIKEVVENFPVEKINKKIAGIQYTAWQLLEHASIAQWDILEFMRDPDYESPDWPDGYWPDKKEATVEDWDNSVKKFMTDLNEIESMVKDETIDITGNLPHSEDFTYLREFILVANHNTYHLGQLMLFNKSE